MEKLEDNVQISGTEEALGKPYQMYLLFADKGSRPTAAAAVEALRKVFGQAETAATVDDRMTTFSIPAFCADYSDAKNVPAQVLMGDFEPFQADELTEMERSQLWDCEDGRALLDSCHYRLRISDFLAGGLTVHEKCNLLAGWVEAALELFPDCAALWVPASGKLLPAERARQNPHEDAARFLHFGVNVRFFKVQNSEEMVVDTLGLHEIGLPDVQYHFVDMNPNALVNHAYLVAAYLFANGSVIANGEMIDGCTEFGMDDSLQWMCRHEISMINPGRPVVDIAPGEFAAGNREAHTEAADGDI